MEFTCNTCYDRKALTAMSRAVRKTIRKSLPGCCTSTPGLSLHCACCRSGFLGGIRGMWPWILPSSCFCCLYS